MKTSLLYSLPLLLASTLLAADASPQEDLLAAAKKLGQAKNYSWQTLFNLGPNSQFRPGPAQGKIDQDGTTWVALHYNDTTTEGLVRGTNIVIKTDEGWKTAAEALAGGSGGFNPTTMMARRLQNLKAPAKEAQDLLPLCKELTKEGDTYHADLTETGAKTLLTTGMGRRGGGPPPEPTQARGSVKFSLVEGALTSYEIKLFGKRKNQDGEDVDIERTTSVEIKDVGATKISVPEEAEKKLAARRPPEP